MHIRTAFRQEMSSRFPETTIPSAWMIFIFFGIIKIDFSDGIKWITHPGTTHACIGHDVDLLWKFDEEGATISSLEWYFNKTRIGTSSETENFIVYPPYQDRIERLNRTEIRLKNVSLSDEGNYTFYPVLDWSTSQSMQNISLQVLVPPTHRCSCNINCMDHVSTLTCELEMPDCGKPQVTAVVKRIETLEVLGQENFLLINSSFPDKEMFCCPTGTAMKCVDDSQQFCASVQIPYGDDESPCKGGKCILPDPTNTGDIQKSLYHCDTVSSTTSNIQVFGLPIIAMAVPLGIAIIVILIITYRQRKINKKLGAQVRSLEETLNQNMKRKETQMSLPSTCLEQTTKFQDVHKLVGYFPLLSSSSGQHDDFKNDHKRRGLYPRLQEEISV